MNFKHLIILLIFFAGISSCKSVSVENETSRTEIKKMVTDTETVLVDVRIPEEFSEKTAKGAINIPLATIEQNLDFLKKQKQIVVFCNRGRQAEQAVELLKKNGITNVYSAKTVQNVEAIQNEK